MSEEPIVGELRVLDRALDPGEEDDRVGGLLIKWAAEKHILQFEVFSCEYSYKENKPVLSEFADGHLKWDGCVNIAFSGYLHFCGPEKEPMLGKLMSAIYSLGSKMEAWDGDD